MEVLAQRFPDVTLTCFEKTNHLLRHEKVTNIFLPKGAKAFAWFTFYENRPICIFLNHVFNEIQSVSHKYVAFEPELSLGTILYGTVLQHQHFVAESIYMYKGQNTTSMNFSKQLELMRHILTHEVKHSYFPFAASFHMPSMSTRNVFLEASRLPYPVYGVVQLRNDTIRNNMDARVFPLNRVTCTFHAKKRVETEDVYELYALGEDGQLVYHDTALVNDFKTSHFMRSFFEPRRPTYLTVEESDSEDDEGDAPGSMSVQCLYVPEFKKWKPLFIKEKNIDFLKHVLFHEKKNITS
jgi:hypothetical protein